MRAYSKSRTHRDMLYAAMMWMCQRWTGVNTVKSLTTPGLSSTDLFDSTLTSFRVSPVIRWIRCGDPQNASPIQICTSCPNITTLLMKAHQHWGNLWIDFWIDSKCLSHPVVQRGETSDFWQKGKIGIQQIVGTENRFIQNASLFLTIPLHLMFGSHYSLALRK